MHRPNAEPKTNGQNKSYGKGMGNFLVQVPKMPKPKTFNCLYVWTDLNSGPFDLFTHEYFCPSWKKKQSTQLTVENGTCCFVSFSFCTRLFFLWLCRAAPRVKEVTFFRRFIFVLITFLMFKFILSISSLSHPVHRISNRNDKQQQQQFHVISISRPKRLLFLSRPTRVRIFIWQCFPIIYAFWLFSSFIASSVMSMATTIDAHKNA